MVIDIHAHITAYDLTAAKAELLRTADLFQIDRIYVSGLKSYYSNEEEIALLNQAVYSFMKEQPARVGGAVYVNPKNKNVMDVVKCAVEEQGFEMIKLWVCTFADDPAVDPIMAYAEQNGVPVLFHAFHKATMQVPNESTGIHIANIARRHPHTKIIMAHLGGNCYDGIPSIRDCKNVWSDLSGSIYGGDALNYAVENIGAERILFGSDMPASFLVNVGKVQGADLSQEQREMIYWKNAKKLLNRSFRV